MFVKYKHLSSPDTLQNKIKNTHTIKIKTCFMETYMLQLDNNTNILELLVLASVSMNETF